MIGKLNIKLYGSYAQLFVGTHYAGTIIYDEHRTTNIHDGWSKHLFLKNGSTVATIDARGGEHGTSM